MFPGMDARQIIGKWPTQVALAADLGLPAMTVHSWFHRNSIPVERFPAIIAAARQRKIPLTYEMLVKSRAAAA